MIDSTPPVLTNLSFPKQIDFSNEKIAFTVTAEATDDFSGIEHIYVTFDSLIGLHQEGIYSASSVWEANQSWNFYSSDYFSLDKEKIINISSIELTDYAGNIINYSKDFLTGMGFQTSFVLKPDTQPPSVLDISPINHSSNVLVDSNIIITLSEDIKLGYGNIEIRSGSMTGDVIETYLVQSSSNLTIDGSILTINPNNDLDYNTNYYVTFAPDTIMDLAGNSYTGVIAYDFKTATLVINGTENADSLIGTSGSETINGFASDDSLIGAGGNDSINGDSGIDTCLYSLDKLNYTLSKASSGFIITSDIEGEDTLQNIERIQFSDTRVAIDLDGNAGTTAKIIGSVFGNESLSDKQYVGIGLQLLDGGMSYSDLMKLAIDARLGDGASHTDVVNLLYTNVVGVVPEKESLDYFVSLLDSNTFTVASLGVMAADTELNLVNINMVGLVQTGIEYL
jgi:hypothetical protein